MVSRNHILQKNLQRTTDHQESILRSCARRFPTSVRPQIYLCSIDLTTHPDTGPQRNSSSKHSMTALILVLFVMSTMHSANYWAYVRRAFITHGQTSQSTADALNEYPDWYLAIASVSDANAILADCVIVSEIHECIFHIANHPPQIWRCWVVWGRSWGIIVVPVICTLLTTGTSCFLKLNIFH